MSRNKNDFETLCGCFVFRVNLSRNPLTTCLSRALGARRGWPGWRRHTTGNVGRRSGLHGSSNAEVLLGLAGRNLARKGKETLPELGKTEQNAQALWREVSFHRASCGMEIEDGLVLPLERVAVGTDVGGRLPWLGRGLKAKNPQAMIQSSFLER